MSRTLIVEMDFEFIMLATKRLWQHVERSCQDLIHGHAECEERGLSVCPLTVLLLVPVLTDLCDAVQDVKSTSSG
jgi:hypothetical protein